MPVSQPIAALTPTDLISNGLDSQVQHRMHGLGLHPAKHLELSAPALKESC